MLNTVLANEKAKKSSLFTTWFERFTALEESALAVESFSTKAVQKDAITYVNRMVEHLFDALVRESGLLAMDKSSGNAVSEAASEVYYNRPAIHTIKAFNRRLEALAKVSTVGKAMQENMGDILDLIERGQALKSLPVVKKPTKAESEQQQKEAAWKSLPKASRELVEGIMEAAKPSLEDISERTRKMLASIRKQYAETQALPGKEGRMKRRAMAHAYGMLLQVARTGQEAEDTFVQGEYNQHLEAIKYGAATRLGGLDVEEVESVEAESGVAGIDFGCRLRAKNGNYRFSFRGIIAGGYNIQRIHVRVIFNLAREQ